VNYYDQDFCFTICFQVKLIDKCNCSDIITPTIRSAKYCETNEELECFDQFVDFFSKSDLNSLCENACPSQCQSIEYKLGLSTSSFPTLSYAKNIQTSYLNYYKFPSDINDTELIEFCNKGFLKVIVSYENLYYTLVDEVPAMTLNDLFGNLGGQLGLFIGISFLSLVELIELIVTLSITVYYQRKGKIIKIPENSVAPLKESVQSVNVPYTAPVVTLVKEKLTSVESIVF
jgi:acid-sensing ion channel 2